MRVVTWNIRFGEQISTASRDLQRIEALRDADIVLLQEMDAAGTAAIACSIGADWVFHSAASHRTSGRDFGNAILSRWPITGAVEIHLPHRAMIHGQSRSATRATVSVAGRSVSAYSVHTEIRSMQVAKRVQQFETIASDVRAQKASLVVVGGDFNTVTANDVSLLRETMASADLTHASATAGPTFRRIGRRFRLDHLFVHGMKARSSGESPEATASDHLPLWIELNDPAGEQ